MSSSTATKGFSTWVNGKGLFGFAIATALGALVAAYPLVGVEGTAGCLALYGIFRWCRQELKFWQVLVLVAVTSYIILNYGFDNLAVGGIFPVGELLMFLALVLVVLGENRGWLRGALLDPPVFCLIALLLLSCAHLVIDVPRYGLYAIRDGSMFFEATFLILGAAWGRNPRNTQVLMRWMFFVFLVNLFYSYTFPWADRIQAWSPISGVFHPVALFGSYQENALFLVLGALYCIWLAPSLVCWPRWVLLMLAAAQLGGLAILQVRSSYVGLAVSALILLLLREIKKLAGLASALVWGIAVLSVFLSTVSFLGVKVHGRMGPVDFSFIEEQAKTVLLLGDPSARMSHDADRSEWYGEVWDRVRSSPSNLIVGEGFGQTLISFENEQGIAVRQPHNSSLTVLARLGLVGLSIWLLFIVLVLARYVRFLQMQHVPAGVSAVVLWLFLDFVLAVLESTVQPSFELSHSAIPFYFLQGLAFGTMRNPDGNLELNRLLPSRRAVRLSSNDRSWPGKS